MDVWVFLVKGSLNQEVIKLTLENRKDLLIFIKYFRFTTQASKKASCIFDATSNKENKIGNVQSLKIHK